MDDEEGLSSIADTARILLAWRGLEARRLAVDLMREPTAGAALAALLGIAFAALRSGFRNEPISEALRLCFEVAASSLAFAALARPALDRPARGPLAGVFYPLLAEPKRLQAYRMLEAALLWSCVLIFASAALATVAPRQLIGFIPAALLGLVATWSLMRLRSPQMQQHNGASDGANRVRPSLRGRLLVARLQWRGRTGRVPAWLAAVTLASFTVGIAALAYRNNADPSLGAGALAAGALLGGAVLGRIDAGLVNFVGHEPLSLMQIVLSAALPTPIMVAISLAGAGVAIGLPPQIALSAAAGVGVGLAAYLAAAVLHALSGRVRFANFAAGIELAICTALLAIYAPLLWVWAPVRVVVLARQAGRLRWTGR